ncbi:MAG: glycosyltransferase family A protein [Halioglobus sp.]
MGFGRYSCHPAIPAGTAFGATGAAMSHGQWGRLQRLADFFSRKEARVGTTVLGEPEQGRIFPFGEVLAMAFPRSQSPDGITRFSIVVNNYNYATYLTEALESAIAQMVEGDELIVVDDGSTDNSRAVLRQYQAEHGIRVIEQENQGQVCAVKAGIAASSGDVVVLLDSDDYFLDGYLDRLRKTYVGHPHISFVFCKARVVGCHGADSEPMRRIMDRNELTPGDVGLTRWAALLFNEFVGVPTSGNSLRRSLAMRAIEFPGGERAIITIPPWLSRILRIPRTEQEKSGYTADGVIVRCASILQSPKYYEERPGFAYRIHGANTYASIPGVGRYYLRYKRKKQFTALAKQHFGLVAPPTATELREEILGRSFNRKWLRRVTIRFKYCCAILASRGSTTEKLVALTAAIGYRPRNS